MQTLSLSPIPTIEDLIEWMTSMRLNISYRGTTQHFILACLELMNQYEDLTRFSVHYQPMQKYAMLQN